jgi:hypothetical protein
MAVEPRVRIHAAGGSAMSPFAVHASQNTTPRRLHSTQMNVPQPWQG